MHKESIPNQIEEENHPIIALIRERIKQVIGVGLIRIIHEEQ